MTGWSLAGGGAEEAFLHLSPFLPLLFSFSCVHTDHNKKKQEKKNLTVYSEKKCPVVKTEKRFKINVKIFASVEDAFHFIMHTYLLNDVAPVPSGPPVIPLFKHSRPLAD